MTGSNGKLSGASISPAPSTTACPAAYSGGSAGTALCGLILSYTPMDNPMVANKMYTGINLGCVVGCGSGGTCPASMTCLGGQLCTPN
jgi:hypothetical protein